MPTCGVTWPFGYFALDQSTAQSSDLESKCLSAMKRAIALDPRNHTFWNALGVFAMSFKEEDYKLAQHCFCKAIQLENNSLSWTNLGVLYLMLG